MRRRHFCLVVCLLSYVSTGLNPARAADTPTVGHWIWFDEGDPLSAAPAGVRFFRKVITLPQDVEKAELNITCDNEYNLFINQKRAGAGTAWETGQTYKVATLLHKGRNVLAVRAKNRESAAGLYVSLSIRTVTGNEIKIATDASWRASRSGGKGWNHVKLDDTSWVAAKVLAPYGKGPWAGNVRWGESNPDRYKVPDGFRVERVAGHSLTGSTIAMTFDDQGRVVISRERGPIFTLIDENGDGECETAIQYSSKIENCQGLCFIKGDLYAMGAGPEGTGLYRLLDENGDAKADKIETLGRFKNAVGEHSAHGMIFGPDGMIYCALGNHVRRAWTPAPDSPLRGYYEGQLLPSYLDVNGHAASVRVPGGTVARLDFQGKSWALVAGGFRNHYDIAFNSQGELFTYDSDMEWDVNLPWYRPTRVNHIIPSGDYGWRTGSGKWPGYYLDSLPTTVDIGRGSPCGVVFYEHEQFPKKYRGAFFMSDWSMGRILVVYFDRAGATYKANWEVFATGRPLNVNDVEVGPEGALYFSTGGRNTEGGVYRVIYGKEPAPVRSPARTTEDVVKMLQPNAAWARAQVRAVKEAVGDRWEAGLLRVARDDARPARQRTRALTLLQQYGPQPRETVLHELAAAKDPLVRAQAVYLLGLHPTEATRKVLDAKLADADPLVCRRACEAFVRTGLMPATPKLIDLLAHEDRWVNYAARVALQRVAPASWRSAVLADARPKAAINGMLALILRDAKEAIATDVADKQLKILSGQLSNDVLLDAIRLAQVTHIMACGKGPLPKAMDQMVPILLRAFEQDDMRLKRESARLLAHLQAPEIIGKMLDAMASGASRQDQIHYAYCLRTIKTGWTQEQRDRFVDWFSTTQDWSGGHSFAGYLDVLWEATLALLPPAERDEILADVEEPAAGSDPISQAIAQAKAAKNRHDPEKLKAFVLSDPAGRKGDPKRGKEVFKKAGCAACHKFGDLAPGRGVGPDLTTLASRFKRSEILESILEPNKVISDQYRAINVVTKDGAIITGIPLREDEKKLVLKQTNGGQITIARKELARKAKAVSMMPDGTLNVLTFPQIADLFAFLEKTPDAATK